MADAADATVPWLAMSATAASLHAPADTGGTAWQAKQAKKASTQSEPASQRASKLASTRTSLRGEGHTRRYTGFLLASDIDDGWPPRRTAVVIILRTYFYIGLFGFLSKRRREKYC